MQALARMTERLIGQPMFQLLARAQSMERRGSKVMHFEIGDLGFSSPATAVAQAYRALERGETGYTSSIGLFELREAIARYVESTHGFTPSLDQVLVAPANAAIDFTVRCIANPGDEVILPDPGFPTYAAVLACADVTPVPVTLRPEAGFRLRAADIREKITPRTRLIIINTPHNPTGACIEREDLTAIARLAEEHDLFLLSDEVYARLTFGASHHSLGVADGCRRRTVVIGSLSKSHAMAGWRLGYVVAPPRVIEKMDLLLQTVLSCLPAFTQRGGIAALADAQAFVPALVAELRTRRDRLVAGLNRIPGIECGSPDGAFYLFPRISLPDLSIDEYAEQLLTEEEVCLLPGHYFGAAGHGFVRLSFARAGEEIIAEMLSRLERFHRRRWSA